MAAEGIQLPWRGNGSIFSANLEAIWGMSVKTGSLRRVVEGGAPLRRGTFYRGRFPALGAAGWSAQWVITGPRKDQRLDSLYTRVRAA